MFDYLIEWEYSKEDKLKPTAAVVKGSHFVFCKPLAFRRYMEQNHLSQQHVTQPVVCLSPSKPRTE